MNVFSGLLEPTTALKKAVALAKARQAGDGNRAESHLQHLERLFPGCAWLTVPQVAACLKLTAGHIYNLHSMGKLPFKIVKHQSGRLRVSVHDIAAYMDEQQTQVLEGQRPLRGSRLRWLQASDPSSGPDGRSERGCKSRSAH